jgi:high-affinity iron transporter
VVLFYVSFWLVARLDQRRWMEFVKAKVWTAASTGSTLALAAVGFTAVYREGFETVLFYQALLSFSEGLEGWVWLGVGLAAAALGVVGFLIFRAGRRLPVKAFLGAAVVLIMVMSVAMLGSAVRELQEAAIVPVTFVDWLPSLPIYLADLTGWHPTLQTVVAQLALAAVYVTGAVWMFVIRPRRAGPRGERPVETTEPAEPVRQP